MTQPFLSVTEPTREEKIALLKGWVTIVEKECSDISVAMEKKLTIYRRLRSQYDSWLAKRMKWINTLEKRLNSRKAQLKEIQTELAALESESQNHP